MTLTFKVATQTTLLEIDPLVLTASVWSLWKLSRRKGIWTSSFETFKMAQLPYDVRDC